MGSRYLSVLVLLVSIGTLILAQPTSLGIAGGEFANIEDHPWVVTIWALEMFQLCNGFLINHYWVLTTASCVSGAFGVIGGANISMGSGDGFGISPIQNTYKHPDYQEVDGIPINDIAVLLLETPLYGFNLWPIHLPEAKEPILEGTSVIIAGTGFTNESSDSNYWFGWLKQAELTVINSDDCANKVKLSTWHYAWECASDMTNNVQGACVMDAGGPVEVNGTAVGLISYLYSSDVSECGYAGYPTIFTRVSEYRYWIKEVTGI